MGSSLFCVDILTKTNAIKLKNHLTHREWRRAEIGYLHATEGKNEM